MIYALKLLVAVFSVTCLAAYVFRSAFKDIFTAAEYKRIWTYVLLGVVATYVCMVPGLYLVVIAGISIFFASATGRGPVGKVAVCLLFACTLPPIGVTLGGFGGINYILSVDHLRLDSALLLTWAAVELAGTKSAPRTVKFFWIDVFVVAYQCLRWALAVPQSSGTTLLRLLVESSLDVLLPYFVVSRALRSMADIRFVAGHLLVGLCFVAVVGIAETLLQHNLYSGLQTIYGVHWQLTYQLMRGGLIRVQATTAQPILLAFMLLFALGIGYWMKGAQWRRPAIAAMFVAFLLTLIATFSRGPWLAAGLMAMALVAMRRLPASMFRVLLVVVTLVAIGLKLANADQAIMAGLGAIFGSDAADLSSIDYRRELLNTSLDLVKQSPWFGVPNYAAQMQNLRQGEGIIDIVNSYVAILLDAGAVGLAIYLMPFLIVLNRLISATARREGGVARECQRFAMAFNALILGALFAIFTTSTWGVMPLLLTLLLAMPTAWLGLSPEEREAPPVPADLELDIPDDPLRGRRLRVGGRLS